MRFMVFVKANKDSEAGTLPTEAMLLEMGAFNEQLVKAGVLLDAGGLKASASAARIDFRGAKPKVIDGPFTEAKELVAGYWLVEMKSMGECTEWFSRCPAQVGEIEIRPLFDAADFAPQVSTPAGNAVLDTVRQHQTRART